MNQKEMMREIWGQIYASYNVEWDEEDHGPLTPASKQRWNKSQLKVSNWFRRKLDLYEMDYDPEDWED